MQVINQKQYNYISEVSYIGFLCYCCRKKKEGERLTELHARLKTKDCSMWDGTLDPDIVSLTIVSMVTVHIIIRAGNRLRI